MTDGERIVIVGGGVGAGSLVATLYKLRPPNAGMPVITIFSDENLLPYRRSCLHTMLGNTEAEIAGVDHPYNANTGDLTHTDRNDSTMFILTEAMAKEITFVNATVSAIDPGRHVCVAEGKEYGYDKLVLATGSTLDPPLPIKTAMKAAANVFAYRTISDVHMINMYLKKAKPKRCVVIGGGVRGLEAAAALCCGTRMNIMLISVQNQSSTKPLLSKKGERHLKIALQKKVFFSDCDSVESFSYCDRDCDGCNEIDSEGNARKLVCSVNVRNGDDADGILDQIDTDIVIVTEYVRTNDKLARDAGLDTGPLGGVKVNGHMQTSDKDIFALGECACSPEGVVHTMETPVASMVNVLAMVLMRMEWVSTFSFGQHDQLLHIDIAGIDVSSFGNSEGDSKNDRIFEYSNDSGTIYRRIVMNMEAEEVVGGVLIGCSDDLHYLVSMCRGEVVTPQVSDLERLVMPAPSERYAIGDIEDLTMQDDDSVCLCKSIGYGAVVRAIRTHGLEHADQVTQITGAGSGCGGCLPLINLIVTTEMKKQGKTVKKIKGICANHFPEVTRQDVYQQVKEKKLSSYTEVYDLLAEKPAGKTIGHGCHVCKVTVANVLSSVNNDFMLADQSSQIDNDRYLANIQRGGVYSVIPRMAGGEVTSDQLLALSEISKEFHLYPKITSQRVGLFGARIQDLPEIWRRMNAVGLYSGTAYSKSLRNVKSCIGLPWCHLAMGRSVDVAVRLEHRYKNIRAPHKFKGAVSACLRDCGEAKAKDFGLISAGNGRWSVFVGGNAGAIPRSAEILVSDVDEEMAVRVLDRYLMYYIRTAKFGDRTARWLASFPGGLEGLKSIIVDDSKGIALELEAEMQGLVDRFRDEWAESIEDDEFARLAGFQEFGNSDAVQVGSAASAMERVNRGHHEPGDWPAGDVESIPAIEALRNSAMEVEVWAEGGTEFGHEAEFVMVGHIDDVPPDQGMNFIVKGHQVAVFRLGVHGPAEGNGSESDSNWEWRATQSKCPHKGDHILHRGVTGATKDGAPTVACPFHRKLFALDSGACISDPEYIIRTLPVEIRNGEIWVSAAVIDPGASVAEGKHTSLDW